MVRIDPAAGAAAGLIVGPLIYRTARRLSPVSPPPRRAIGVLASIGTALVLGAIGGRVGGDPALPAHLYVGAAAILLSAVDVTTRRLPDAVTLPSYWIVGGWLTGAAVIEGGFHPLARALAAMAVLWLSYFAVCVAGRGQGLGFGDVKLAGFLGLDLGWFGWRHVLSGVLAAHALSAVAVLIMVLAGRGRRGATLPFGPYLCAGWLIAVLRYG